MSGLMASHPFSIRKFVTDLGHTVSKRFKFLPLIGSVSIILRPSVRGLSSFNSRPIVPISSISSA
jgi:hypothetical protein